MNKSSLGMRRSGIASGPRQQRGISMIIVTIGMVAILSMVGLALDMGDVYINKTRLQNALDAAALSAAQQLVLNGGDTEDAETAAHNTFDLNKDEGNEELGSITASDVVVEFSDTLEPWIPNSGTNFVRVGVSTFTLRSFLISVLGIDEKTVAASATAGPAPAQCPSLFPVLACGDPEDEPDFGYKPGEQVMLKTHADDSECEDADGDTAPCNGPGNFQLLDVGSGARAVRDAICGIGTHQCVPPGEDMETEPGNTVGPVGQAINAMFKDYQGPVTKENCPNWDTNTEEYGPGDGPYFGEYRDAQPEPSEGEIVKPNRVVPVPVGVCTDEGGKKVVEMLGQKCFLITRKAERDGDTQRIYGEFLEDGACLSSSHIAPDPDASAGSGPVVIVLYKDQIMDDG